MDVQINNFNLNFYKQVLVILIVRINFTGIYKDESNVILSI